MRHATLALSAVLSSVLSIASCGGGPAPSAPEPTPTAAASPTPEPTPEPTPSPLSAIPPCQLPPSRPTAPVCTDPVSAFTTPVNAASDRVLKERPDIFSFASSPPKVLKFKAYIRAVRAALGQAGFCTRHDSEGEIGVKKKNPFSEQWIVMSSASLVRRHYVGACAPALF